jgi:hypothetical protein
MMLKWIRSKFKGKRKEFIGKLVINHLKFLNFISGSSPIPLSYWFFFRKVIGIVLPENNPIFPPYELLRSTGKTLGIPVLERFLSDDILGDWALDAQTIRFIWTLLWKDRPQVILECGSGISTIVFAVYASLYFSLTKKDCHIISLEQDLSFRIRLENRLKENNLDRFVNVLYCPLDEHFFYDLHNLELLLVDKCVQWVLIDGPSGPPGCRYGTLPSLLKFCCPKAKWFLDDAFRDAELQILRRWQRESGIIVEGIYPIGKGLAVGYVK